MRRLLSSPARLVDAHFVKRLSAYLAYHGALGSRIQLDSQSDFGDEEKFDFLPLVFGLLPRTALVRSAEDVRVKPLLRAHLHSLGVVAPDVTIDVLKSVCDQYFETRSGASPRKRKATISDVRQNRVLYQELLARQGKRCALCGVMLGGADADESLDHVVPFRLIGDIPDGANYQLLCVPCNSAKGSKLSSLMAPAAYNWVYSRNDPIGTDTESTATAESRFVRLAQERQCMAGGCGVTPLSGRLDVAVVRSSGLSVADNLVVLCEQHLLEWSVIQDS